MQKRITPDKWRHFIVGILMGAVLQVFLWNVLAGHPVFATVMALLAIVVISYGFELFSLYTGMGHYDFIDAVATTIGGILGMAVILIFQLQYMV